MLLDGEAVNDKRTGTAHVSGYERGYAQAEKDTEAERDCLRGRIAQLEQALRKHGEHRPMCQVARDHGMDTCSCGLDAVLANTVTR